MPFPFSVGEIGGSMIDGSEATLGFGEDGRPAAGTPGLPHSAPILGQFASAAVMYSPALGSQRRRMSSLKFK